MDVPLFTLRRGNYGDFKFDHLEENSGTYTVEIHYQGYETKTLEFDLKNSLNLGTIFLEDFEP